MASKRNARRLLGTPKEGLKMPRSLVARPRRGPKEAQEPSGEAQEASDEAQETLRVGQKRPGRLQRLPGDENVRFPIGKAKIRGPGPGDIGFSDRGGMALGLRTLIHSKQIALGGLSASWWCI